MDGARETDPLMAEQAKTINGTVSRILQFGQLVVLGAVLPWGVWVTGQIYGLQTSVAQQEQWRVGREKTSIATMTDLDNARLRVKDEMLTILTAKIDEVSKTVNDIDKRLREHDAMTRQKLP